MRRALRKPGVPTTSNFVTKARSPFTRASDQLGKISIFSFAINPVTIFFKLGGCIPHGASETMSL